jgi:putative transposase
MRRHSKREIASALVKARELEQAGRAQADICKQLGVSVMTLHRWRHAQARPAEPATGTVREYLEENRRLKRIVVDLLLEKAKLLEGITDNSSVA